MGDSAIPSPSGLGRSRFPALLKCYPDPASLSVTFATSLCDGLMDYAVVGDNIIAVTLNDQRSKRVIAWFSQLRFRPPGLRMMQKKSRLGRLFVGVPSQGAGMDSRFRQLRPMADYF